MKTIKIISIIVSGALCCMIIYFIRDIRLNMEEYAGIYRIDSASVYWSKQSMSNFLLEKYSYLMILVVILVTNIFGLVKSMKILDRICTFFFGLLTLWVIYHIVMYFSDGYGH
jgi:hypothetical protein